MGSEQLYSVPSVLVFRSWASNADPDAVIKRRLLLKNDSQRPLCFRLSLPQHPAFQVSGSLVPDAPGDVCNVTLPAAGSTSLTVTLLREHADEIECRDELCLPPSAVSAPAALGFRMLSNAALTHRPSAFARMSAANSVPVPIGLVRIKTCPDFIPPFFMSFLRSATPCTANPNANSEPS